METITIYPFKDITIEQILRVNSTFEQRISNHGHSTSFRFKVSTLNDDDKGILSYFCFLKQQIDYYHERMRTFIALEISIPSIYEYLDAIINTMNIIIDKSIINKNRPFPADIMLYLEQESSIQYVDYLYEVINELLKSKGYSTIPGNLNDIKHVENREYGLQEKVKNVIDRVIDFSNCNNEFALQKVKKLKTII